VRKDANGAAVERLAQVEDMAGADAPEFAERHGQVAHLEAQRDLQRVEPVDRQVGVVRGIGREGGNVWLHGTVSRLLDGDARAFGEGGKMPPGGTSQLRRDHDGGTRGTPLLDADDVAGPDASDLAQADRRAAEAKAHGQAQRVEGVGCVGVV